MGPTVRKAIGNAALALALASMAMGAVAAWKRYGRANPYQGMDRRHVADPNAVIKGTGVEIRHYENGKRVASAHADALTIGQNRGVINLKGIRNGLSQTPQGPMQFAAGAGVLRPTAKMIDVSGGVRVKGKGGTDFDIQSDRASIDGRIGEVVVPTPLRGTIMGGPFTAASMTRRMNSDHTEILRPNYTLPAGRLQNAPKEIKDRTWHFTGERAIQDKGIHTALDAYASDEKMVVTAPKIVEDAKTKIVTATSDGKVRATYRSAKADIVADKVVIFRDEKKAVCTGRVLVYVRPKSEWDKPLKIDEDERGPLVPDIPPGIVAKIGQGGTLTQSEKDRVGALRSGGNLRDYPMQMAAEEVTYWYKEGERRAIVKGGNPTAFQKFDDGHWRQVWAPEAHYDGEKDMLDLIGGDKTREVHLKNSLEDVTDCFTAKMSTKEDQKDGEEYVETYRPKGHLIDFDDDKPGGGSKAGGAKPTAPKPNGDPKAPPSGTPLPTKP